MADEKEKNSAVEFIDSVSNVKSQVFDKEKGGISLSEIFHSITESLKNVQKRIVSYFAESSEQNDNIHIPSDTKTLLGKDFSVLYNGNIGTKILETSDGASEFLKPETSYDTDMKESHFLYDKATSYNDLPTSNKVVYEVSLLTKKYASQYNENDVQNNESLVQNYEDDLNSYKEYCANQGVDWQNVMSTVSYEMQSESGYYIESGDSGNLRVSNLAHNLLITCEGDSFTDTLLPELESKGITYEDTLSLNTETNKVSLISKAENAFRGATSKISSGIASLWRSGKELLGLNAKDSSETSNKRYDTAVSELGTFEENNDSDQITY